MHDPSGTEIPRGWRGLIRRTICGRGMDIFWNHTIDVFLVFNIFIINLGKPLKYMCIYK